MNYLVKNAKILIKFFTNKSYKTKKLNEAYVTLQSFNSLMGNKLGGESKNLHFIANSSNNTYLSFPSFQNNKEKNSLYNQNMAYSSSSSNNQNMINSNNNLTLTNPNTNIINNTITNQTLNLFISQSPNNYLDLFTQNEIEWNYVRRDMVNFDNKSIMSDQTPTFSSN